MKTSKRRIFDVIQIGNREDLPSLSFDIFIVICILVSLFTAFFSTFEESARYSSILSMVELVTCIIFAIEYVLRLWTAEYLYPSKTKLMAAVTFALSFYGIVDFLTFFPFFLPFSFPAGIVAFRVFRVLRIFKLFRINAQYDAFNVITDVLKSKKDQIISSVVIIFIFMLAASMCMYSIEHEVQPDKFTNAFSGIWWAASTLLTVGYGDVYPITVAGKIVAMIITFLGVGLVAIPTGIISAGFVEQYTKINQLSTQSEEKELSFVVSTIPETHPWNGKLISEIICPPQLIIASIIRDDESLTPNGDTRLQHGDVIVMAAKHYADEEVFHLKEVKIKSEHEWVGKEIRNLDISRLDLIVMINRTGNSFIPKGSTKIRVGDELIIYSREA